MLTTWVQVPAELNILALGIWNTEPLLCNGERRASNEFSLRPTRDPSARRRRLTPEAKRPSSHPRLRRPKGALCFTHRPSRIRKSARSPNGDCSRRRHQASRIETADRRRRASLTLALRSGIKTGWGLSPSGLWICCMIRLLCSKFISPSQTPAPRLRSTSQHPRKQAPRPGVRKDPARAFPRRSMSQSLDR